MELINLASLTESEHRELQSAVQTQQSLGDVLEYLRVRGLRTLPTLVIQDEYSHDLTFGLPGGLYLSYAAT